MQKRDDQEVLVRCWKNKQCSSKCMHRALAPDHMPPRASNDHTPPVPPISMLCTRRCGLGSKHCFFADEHPPPTSSRTTLKEGGRGGVVACIKSAWSVTPTARFMTEHCLFFQHRELLESLHLILHANPERPRTLDAQCRLCGFDECKVGEATEVAVQKMCGLGSPPRTDPGYPVLARMR